MPAKFETTLHAIQRYMERVAGRPLNSAVTSHRQIAKQEVLGLLELSQPDEQGDGRNGRFRYVYPNPKNPTLFLGVDGAKVTTVVTIDPKDIRARERDRREEKWLLRHGQGGMVPGNGQDAVRSFKRRRAELDKQVRTALAVFEEEEL